MRSGCPRDDHGDHEQSGRTTAAPGQRARWRRAGHHRAGRGGEGLRQRPGQLPRAERREPGHLRRRDGRHHRPFGQRQEHDHQPHRRHRPAHRGHGDGRRQPPRPDVRGQARRLARPHPRHRLPVLPANANPHGHRERHAPAGSGPGRPPAVAAGHGGPQPGHARASRPRRPAAAGTIRRRAAAGRDRQGDGLQPAGPARRRANRQPRHRDGAGHVPAAQAPERRRHHGGVRHPRPGACRDGIPDRVRPRRPDRRRHRRPVMNTLNRKAWGDLTRHRARTLLTAFTLGIAIASLGFLAVPILLNAAMSRQVAASHLYDVGLSTNVIDLTPAQLAALGRLPGVAAVSPALGFATEATSVAGAQDVEIAGTALASAPVNTVPLLSGRMPGPGEVIADAADGRATGYAVPVGGTIKVRAASGAMVPLRVTGTGLNLAATPGATGSGTPVFYATQATTASLRGVHGVNYLGFRLTDDTPPPQSPVAAEVRAYLTAQTGSDPITSLPATRAVGQWPGQPAFARIMALLYIITILAFLSALFLIAATMNAVIAEQAGEIAVLKTLGGRRRQIGGIILRTAAMIGAAGAVAGTAVGIVIAYLLSNYFAAKFVDVSFGFGISAGVVVASLLLGPVLAVAASLPALRRALRRPVAETLAATGTGGYGSGWLERAAARVLAGPRVPESVRIGARNALRQKRRSVAAIAQVAVAAGLAIAFLGLGQSVNAVIGQTIGLLRFSFSTGMAATGAARPFGGQALAIATSTPGVTGGQLVETSAAQYAGQTYVAWGLGAHPLYSYRLSAGHWFTAADVAPGARPAIPPVVLGPGGARPAGRRVGQVLTLTMAAGPTRVRVTGIDTGQLNGGGTIYFPLPVLERLDGGPGTADSMWFSTASSGHAAIDRVTAAAAARLTAAGYPVSTQEIYVTEKQITAAETSILTIVEILGLLVVAIMLMGLVSALSMGVIERTREVGILRCVGGRARNIRRIFSSEAVILAVVGWAFGVLLGWLIYQGLLALLLHNAGISLPQEVPPVIPLSPLAGVLVLTLLVIRPPLRRATRIQPGTALRYQ